MTFHSPSGFADLSVAGARTTVSSDIAKINRGSGVNGVASRLAIYPRRSSIRLIANAIRITARSTPENPSARSGHTTAASGKCLTTTGSGTDLADKNFLPIWTRC